MVRPVSLEGIEFTGLRGRVAAFVESPVFVNFITMIILINAVTMGLETSHEMMGRYGTFLHVFDKIAVAIFCVEIILKLSVYRLRFFHVGWNIFDFVIVAISVIPSSGGFSVLRTLRVFRVMRLMSVVPQMRRVVSALFRAAPGMLSIMGMLLVLFYVGAVLTTQLFGQASDPRMQEYYGTVGSSMFSLFQVMTLESWAQEIARPTMRIYPWAWMFFVPFIVISSFAVLNLFIGIIVDALNLVQEADLEEDREEITNFMHYEMEHLRQEIFELKQYLKQIWPENKM